MSRALATCPIDSKRFSGSLGQSTRHDRDMADDTDTRVIRHLADKLADQQMAERELRTEALHTLIAKYVAAAREAQPDKQMKVIVADAVAHYGVSERTVWTAIRAIATD
jgi:hypothetical protein